MDKPDNVVALVGELQKLAVSFSERASELARLPQELADRVKREVQGEVTAQAVQIIAREVTMRFDRELSRRLIEEVDKQLPGAMKRYAVVPLEDVTDAVEKALDQAIARRLTQLIGSGALTVGVHGR